MMDLSLPNTNCEKCGLFQTCLSPFMESEGPTDTRTVVLVIGEAPGAEEDEKSRPFVGRSGRLLREALSEFFDIERDVRFTNVVRCRPPENKVKKKYINCCVDNVLQEVECYDPDLVLLMGNTPLNAILGESGITTWNGVVVEREERVYAPLFHPAFILRNDNALDDWLEAMMKAEDTLRGKGLGRGDGHYKYVFPMTMVDVYDMQVELNKWRWIAFDTETSGLDAHSDDGVVLAVSFATEETAYAVPLGHPESPFTDVQIDKIVGVVDNILEKHSGRVIGHNIKFDQQQWYQYGGCWFEAGGDTMLVSHLLDSKKGIHSLKRLAGLHLGMYDYDKELRDYTVDHPEANPRRGGTYAAIPLDILLPYAGMDASATYMLHPLLCDKLSDKQKLLYKRLVMKVSDAVAQIENDGMVIDTWVAERYRRIYTLVQRGRYEGLLKNKFVRRLTRDRQAELDIENALHPRRKPRHFQFNPRSYPQLRDLYYEYAGVPVSEHKTDTGLPTTKYEVVKAYESEHPIIAEIRSYKLLGDMLSKYLNPAAFRTWESDDGRVHTNFNIHGTKTGRLSSNDPNVLNIPTPEKEPGTLLESLPIKNVFTHSYWNNGRSDGVVMSLDYAGIELRVFASIANCKAMLEIHKSGVDFHTMVASMMSGIPYEDITKPIRYVYKWTNWTMIFGGGAHTLHNMYDIPMDEADAAVAEYLDRFPEVREYQEETIEFVKEHGYAESPFGRRAYFPYINDRGGASSRAGADRRSAINMPIQSAASDITLIALVIINHSLRKDGFRSRIINSVYDSILLDVPNDEINEVARLCVAIMEDIQGHAEFYAPGINLSWLRCPLKADVEVGTHYGVGEHYAITNTS